MSINAAGAENPEIFITADLRCGGTAFTQIARILLDAPCVDDPYSENWLTREEPDLPCIHAPEGDPVECLDKLYKRWRVVKHSSTVWPASTYQPLLSAVAERGCLVVLLWRENALQRAMSLALAEKTSIFGNYDWTHTPRDDQYSENKVELDIGTITRFVENYRLRTADVREILQQSIPGFFEISYEELFGITQTLDHKLGKLKQLCEFWSVDPKVICTQRDWLVRVLSPSQKMNTPDLYRKMVINIDDIAEALKNVTSDDLWAIY